LPSLIRNIWAEDQTNQQVDHGVLTWSYTSLPFITR